MTESPATPQTRESARLALPATGFVAWVDWDHVQHVAFLDGHPMNNVWVFDGKRLEGKDLLAVMNGAKPYPLLLLAKAVEVTKAQIPEDQDEKTVAVIGTVVAALEATNTHRDYS